MSRRYKVVWVGPTTREWAPQAAPDQRNLAYEVKFEGDDRVIEWSRRESTDAPQVGEVTPPGDINNSAHGPQFKIDWDAMRKEGGEGSEGRSGGSRGSTRDWTPDSERDPEKVARIGRSAAQKAAVALVTAMPGFGSADDSKRQEVLLRWVNFFDLDIDEAGAAAKKVATGVGVAPPGETVHPAGSASPAPAQSPENDPEIPF